MGADNTDAHVADNALNKEAVDLVESGSASSQEIGWTEKQTKALVRKMDWALLPFLALLYLLSFLDRSASLPPATYLLARPC